MKCIFSPTGGTMEWS